MPNWAVNVLMLIAKTPIIRLFSTTFKDDTVTKDKNLIKARQ